MLSRSTLYSVFFIDREADMETDGISIITESDGTNELEQTLSLVESKEKKYMHHPNTYLNTRLNVLLVISFAAVTGLGIGHFLGNSEDSFVYVLVILWFLFMAIFEGELFTVLPATTLIICCQM